MQEQQSQPELSTTALELSACWAQFALPRNWKSVVKGFQTSNYYAPGLLTNL
jgi:hypothetical protein